MENKINVGDQNAQKIGQNLVETPQYNFQKPKFNYWVISAFILIAVLAFGGIFALYNNQKQNKPQPTSLTVQPSPTTTTPHSQVFPVKVYGLQIDNSVVEVKGSPAPCQPEFFDPKVNKFVKVKQSGTPSELYKIQGFQDDIDSGVMMIDGWYKEGEDKVVLPSPFNVTIYNFGCASSFSSVIDLTKNGNRQALYTHVLHYSFSKDGKRLFLVNNINNQGTWVLHKRIIDIETKETSEIPNIKCVSELDGFWQGDRLITYTEDREEAEYQTDICVWDKSAKLISKIGATTAWGAASRDFLAEKIGILPTEPDIFYAYTSKDENTCSLFLANIVNNTTKSIDILDKRSYPQNYYCASPDVEFDFSGLFFDRGILKYRIEKDRQSSGQAIWGDWRTTTITNNNVTNADTKAIQMVQAITEVQNIEKSVEKAGRKPFYTPEGRDGDIVTVSLRESFPDDPHTSRIDTFNVNITTGIITVEDVVSGGQISLEEWKKKVNQSWGF